MPIVLDGKALARIVEAELAPRVKALAEITNGEPPVLAVILAGGDPASAAYARLKAGACRRVGMELLRVSVAERTTTGEMLAVIDDLNGNPRVHGILLQYPVPPQIDERLCFDRIDVEKDVDGVNSLSFGRMAMNRRAHGSATPGGIMRLLRHYGIPVEGREAVVVGRGPLLGKPMAMMLLGANATVTVCDSGTRCLPDVVRRAELVVGAIGKPEFIRGDWIRDGAVLIDAGYHPGGVGDIELSAAIDRCFAYTPVPGGAGPMTIATLLAQTVDAAERRAGRLSAATDQVE